VIEGGAAYAQELEGFPRPSSRQKDGFLEGLEVHPLGATAGQQHSSLSQPFEGQGVDGGVALQGLRDVLPRSGKRRGVEDDEIVSPRRAAQKVKGVILNGLKIRLQVVEVKVPFGHLQGHS